LKFLCLTPGVRYILASTFFFALMNIGVKYLADIPAHEVVFFRALVSLIVCYFLILRKGLNPWGNNKPVLILRGNMPLASAATIQYLSPIFTIIIAGFLVKETTRPVQWLFFIISFAGVIMIKGFDPRVTPPDLMIGVAAAVGSGFAYNFIRKLKDHDHPLVVVFYFPLVTVPLIGVYTATHWVSPKPLEWLILILIGLVVTVAQIFMTKGYQLERASNVSNFNYLGVVFALGFGFLLFDELVEPLGLAGIALIIGGVIMSSRYRKE